MIRLCYPRHKIDDRELVHFTIKNLVYTLSDDKDLVIVHSPQFLGECMSSALISAHNDNRSKHFLYFHEKNSIIDSSYIDLEKFINQPLRNIVLINFDSMDSSVLKCLVNKSKKTEIIGISNDHTDYYSEMITEIHHYKYNGFSDDQIIVLMSLEYNCPPVVISKCLDNVKMNEENIKLRTVEHIDDIIPYLKH